MVIHRTNSFYEELLADGHVAESSQVGVVEPYCCVEKSPFRLCGAEKFLVSDSSLSYPNLDPHAVSSGDLCHVERVPIYNLSELPYSPAPFVGPEPLLYVTFYILGRPVKALVDSGASRSFIGPKGLELIKDLGLKVENKQGRVLVVNSQVELVSQEIVTRMEFHNL